MAYPQFDRFKIQMKSLKVRKNKKQIDTDHVSINEPPQPLSPQSTNTMNELVAKIRNAKRNKNPVMITFGAHTIKNGLATILIKLMEDGWITHLATNGAGIIHDWEFAYQGASSEDVKENVTHGEFGNWEETGYFINLAINVGSYEGKGYGESIGAMIENEKLVIPSKSELENQVKMNLNINPEKSAVAADLLSIIGKFKLSPEIISVPHPWKKYSAQAVAYRLGIPFTGHPMIGHDIIYNHPMNHGGLLGRAALKDFLIFAESVSRIGGGVYVSIGSAVMSPMVFEKSFSMAQNLAIQQGRHIDNHYLLIVDLAESNWDWKQGEPPENNPAYYLRYNKTFSRMGGMMSYLNSDNRNFLLTLYSELSKDK